MKLIFTACTGRCGQNSLASYFNKYCLNTIAEVEPPDLIYKQNWPLGNFARKVQRRWIVTHEDLGRGKSLLWYDNNEDDKLEKIAKKRLRRIKKLNEENYIELSKFFIRSYCDAIYKLRADIGLIKLYRNPLENARSFVNRNKDFSLDGVVPAFKKACFKVDINKLTKFQLYLWQWVEIELRFQEFIKRHDISKYFEFKTEDLNCPEKIEELFIFFGLEYKKPVIRLQRKNTNISQGKKPTVVSQNDWDEFNRFIEMIPKDILKKVKILNDYR